MQNTYQIKPSPSQRRLLLVGHGLFAAVVFLYFEFSLLVLCALLAISLLVIAEHRNLMQRGLVKLHLDANNKAIEFEQDQQPYFYSKYKVHQTRWFAILKLIEPAKTRTLVLNPDCFTSPDSYRRLRYQLRKMEQADVA